MAREIVKLKSTVSHHIYTTTKNKKSKPGRLEMRRYDPVVRTHVLYKEAK
jgi:large subunit ribosomal protein L33